MTLQSDVENYLDHTAVPPSRLGRAALGDPGAIGKLMGGLPFGEGREKRLREFMARYPDGFGARHAHHEAYLRKGEEADLRRNPAAAMMEPGEMCALVASIMQIGERDPSLARLLAEEAARLKMPIAAFLADMVALGFRCHVEDLREDMA